MGVEEYHVIGLVGEGSFGKVYKGRRKYTGQIVAMKFIMKNGKSEKDIHNFRQEIEILRKLKHENIIEMLDSFETAEEFCVVSEFAQILEDDKCLPEAQVQAIAKQLVRALHYLHSNRIIHRDMKPQNILICSGSNIKLCDFGFARAMSMKTVVLHSVKGTPLYMAPELVREQPYNHTVDLYELFVGQPPFYTNSMFTLIRHIVKDPVKYPEQISPEFKSFLQGLLNKVQQQRLSWPAILEHPFIKESSVDLEESPSAAKISMGFQVAGKDNTLMMPLHVHSDPLTSESGQPLDRLENNSCTVEGAKIIGHEIEALVLILEPIKIFSKGTQICVRRDALHSLNQSLRILSNLVAAEAITKTCLDDLIFELLGFTSALLRHKSNDVCDLIAKTLYIIRKLIDGSGLSSGSSYFTQWVALVELYSQSGVPILILQCVDVLGMEDSKRLVAFLGKMIRCKTLAVHLVGKGMLEAARMRRFLDCSCPKEVTRDMLMIVSDLARMHVGFYEYIEKANILIRIKELLTSNDPTLCAKACNTVGNMCRHSSYFYESLAKHDIINLLIDRYMDSDKLTRKFACFAIGNAAFQIDSLYEELRRSISQLTNLLLLPEEDITKLNAAGALSNLVRHSNILCEDIVFNGAIEALLKVVSECSKLAWNSPSMDAVNESPLKNALFALAKMCADYQPCRKLVCLSGSFQVIAQLQQLPESNVAKYDRIICNKAGENNNEGFRTSDPLEF